MGSLRTSEHLKRFGGQLRRRASELTRSALDLVYPPQCAYCHAALLRSNELMLCGECRSRLAPTDAIHCRRCGAAVRPAEAEADDCARCRNERYRFKSVLTLGRYRDHLRDAVLRMKHSAEEPLMMAMGNLLAEQHGEALVAARPDVVVPIPMHWSRRLVRGTNSPEILARRVARRLQLPFVAGALVRKRATKKLALLSREERKRALRDAFAVARGSDFRNAHVLVVDDVLTTGTTCNTAARTLLRAGAKRVSVLVVARAYPED